MTVHGAFFEITGTPEELDKIYDGIERTSGRLTSDESASLDLWLEMKDEWFKVHDAKVREGWVETTQIAPLGGYLKRAYVQEVWDTFVKPDQDAGLPQSAEMRVLMAILRTMYKLLPATPEHPDGGQ